MKKRKIKFIVTMLLYCAISFSQGKQSSGEPNRMVDSLKLILQNAKHDTTRIETINRIAKILNLEQPDESLLFLAKAKELAKKNIAYSPVKVSDETEIALNNGQKPNVITGIKVIYYKKLAATLNAMGTANYIKNNLEKALSYYQQSLKISESIGEKKIIARSLGNIGLIYKTQGKVAEAEENFQLSLKIAKEIGDLENAPIYLNNLAIIFKEQGKIKEALANYQECIRINESTGAREKNASPINNIANIYRTQGQFNEALLYFEMSLKLYEEFKNKNGIALVLNNFGAIYYDQKMPAEALGYLQQSLKINMEINNEDGVANSYENIGSMYSLQGKQDSAINNIKRCLKLREKANDKSGTVSALLALSRIYIIEENINEAFSSGARSLQLAKELGYPQKIMFAAFNLKTIYEKQNNPKKALEVFELYITMRDSVNNEDNRKASYKSHLQYEYSKKALADSIKSVDEKKIASAKLAESQAKLKQEKTQKFALYAGLFLILIFTGFIYNRFKNSQKQKQLIEKQKLVVDESQRKIIASINYAKKIQTSMLPSREEMTQFFKENFVFFKPKDIVSGDFYWFHHADNCSYIAVADCTGHGVPGAFMTMIAHSILNEVVIEQKITSPDEILNNLHSLIFKALKQYKGDEYSQDGMDLSFVKIDHQNKMLTFAGARNNAFIVYDAQVETLKATSKSIGGLSLLGEVEPERKFKMETFQIKENSTLILTTDGIFDQLNNEDKKFGTNRFKEMILKLNTNQESISFLESTFNDWKKTTPQLDDILLVGLKV